MITELLWSPSKEDCLKSNLNKFIEIINTKYHLKINTYEELHEWSVTNLNEFWEETRLYTEIKFEKPHKSVLKKTDKMIETSWFEGATLNIVDRYLRYKDNKIAIKYKTESKKIESLTYKQLEQNVAIFASRLKKIGVTKGDRVAAITTNCPEAIVGFLAAASLGAIWTSCSPDFGEKAILDRFEQIEPKVLIAVNNYQYHGKTFNIQSKVENILKKLIKAVLITIEDINNENFEKKATTDILHIVKENKIDIKLETVKVKFNHPLYILYSSGTTGKPKAIVHSSGGTLLQQLKEHILHNNMKREDNLFYYTTCGWMMWNWLVAALGTGGTITLYDGSPMYPEITSGWDLIEEAGITIFGTSAKFISASEDKKIKFKDTQLKSLRTILSTGSPLLERNFKYIYKDVKKNVQLSSISGGTDIVSCFTLGCSTLPVYKGFLQCRGLGMAVKTINEKGTSVTNQIGELVCTEPSPSMPLYFWNDTNNEKYRKSYFKDNEKIWKHGDYLYIDKTGQCKILGRSDSTLNPGGVRIGTAEIYKAIEEINEIEDSIVVGKKIEGDEHIILFVKLKENKQIDKDTKQKIKECLKTKCSPRHVPRRIHQVNEIPYTLNGKKVEVTVKKFINKEKIENLDSIKNQNH